MSFRGSVLRVVGALRGQMLSDTATRACFAEKKGYLELGRKPKKKDSKTKKKKGERKNKRERERERERK